MLSMAPSQKSCLRLFNSRFHLTQHFVGMNYFCRSRLYRELTREIYLSWRQHRHHRQMQVVVAIPSCALIRTTRWGAHGSRPGRPCPRVTWVAIADVRVLFPKPGFTFDRRELSEGGPWNSLICPPVAAWCPAASAQVWGVLRGVATR